MALTYNQAKLEILGFDNHPSISDLYNLVARTSAEVQGAIFHETNQTTGE
jgi:hypothetical protein